MTASVAARSIVGVAEHEQRVVAAELEHGAPVAEPPGDLLADGDAAGERDDLDRLVGEHLVEDLLALAGDDRERVLGIAGVEDRAASQSAASGVFSDGLSTIGAPAAIAGASLCATWFSGWLKGVIAATSRTGSRIV